MVFPAQNQHRETVEGERPDDAEGISLAQCNDVAPGHNNGEHLQAKHQVDDTRTGAESGMGFAEPVGEDAVFGHAHQHAGGANHGGIDGAGENEEADHHDKDAEGNAPEDRAHHVHGQSGNQVVLVDVGAFPRGDQHGSQERGAAGKDQAVNGDDDGRALEILELGMLDLAVGSTE